MATVFTTDVYQRVTPLHFWTQLAVPTVYGDSLSYLEDVGKLNLKLSEVISSLNGVPEMVDEKIAAAFDQSGIQEEIYRILSERVIDITNPPNGMTAAKGDGVTNNTTAIQSVLNYAAQQNYNATVYVPSGIYLVDVLHLPQNVSIVGENMYTTVFKMPDYANSTMFAGILSGGMLSGFTVDNNAKTNSVALALMDLTCNGSNYIADIQFINSASANTAIQWIQNGTGWMRNVIVNTAKMVNTKGEAGGYQSISHLLMINSSQGLNLLGDNVFVDSAYFKNCAVPATINGNNCVLYASGDNMDKVVDNTYQAELMLDKGKYQRLWSDYKITVADLNVTAQDMEVNVASLDMHMPGDFTMGVGNMDVQVDGSLDTVSASSMETVTNNKEIDAGDIALKAVGEIAVNAQDYGVKSVSNSTVADTVTASAQTFSVKTKAMVEIAESRVSTVANTEVINAEDLILNTVNPITYRKPQQLDDNFNFIPFKTPEGQNIQVLVYNGKPFNPGGDEPSVTPIYHSVKDYGAEGDGVTDDTEAFKTASNFNGFVFVPYGTYKVTSFNLSSGIKGILGEMSTITSGITSGNMISSSGDVLNLNSLILDAPNAENAVMGNGLCITECVINGNTTGTTLMTNTRVNNSSTITLDGNGALSNNVLNANIAIKPGSKYQISNNLINGSFVLSGVTTTAQVEALAVSGNTFNADTTLSPTLIKAYSASGNNGLADYPEIDIPTPTPPFNYTIPYGTGLKFNGSSGENFYQFALDGSGNMLLTTPNASASDYLVANELEARFKILRVLNSIIMQNNLPITLLNSNSTVGYQIIEHSNNNFAIQKLVDSNWSNILYSDGTTIHIVPLLYIDNNVLLKNNTPFYFVDNNNTGQFRFISDGTNFWLQARTTTNTWNSIYTFTITSNFIINKVVQASQGVIVPQAQGYRVNNADGTNVTLRSDNSNNVYLFKYNTSGSGTHGMIFLANNTIDFNGSVRFVNNVSINGNLTVNGTVSGIKSGGVIASRVWSQTVTNTSTYPIKFSDIFTGITSSDVQQYVLAIICPPNSKSSFSYYVGFYSQSGKAPQARISADYNQPVFIDGSDFYVNGDLVCWAQAQTNTSTEMNVAVYLFPKA